MGETVAEQVLAARLSAIRGELELKLAALEAGRESGAMTAAQVAGAAREAQAVYDRDRGLAQLAAETGWQTWVGVGGVLYARRERSSPPWVVRAASAAELRQRIAERQGMMPG